mmetsp:Transcript_102917/g.327125  ORF Transcript_102917/g.327125 Transcript_102917/m.327125 type:complete len:96 (+) Transcript_102917:185-472(+)
MGSCGLESRKGSIGSASPPPASCSEEALSQCELVMHSASSIFAPLRPLVLPPMRPAVRAPERLAGSRLDTSLREPGIARPRADEAERLIMGAPNA